MIDPLDTRRKRLLFRSWHRGTKETDLLLGSFAERHLPELTPDQLDRYEALVDREDSDLYDWLIGRLPPPPEFDTDVFRMLLAFRYMPRSA
jgi:antitoxin CptB